MHPASPTTTFVEARIPISPPPGLLLSACVRSGSIAACRAILDGLTTTQRIAVAAGSRPAEEEGLTPLAIAAKMGSAPLCELLVDSGFVAPGDVDASGRTPLHHAAAAGLEFDVLRLLLPFGINAVDTGGKTALHLASANGKSRTVEDLLRLGANPDVADSESGDTPLHHAARAGDISMCEALLRACKEKTAQVAVSRRNVKGDTPRGIAYSTPHQAILRLFIEKADTERIVSHAEDHQEQERKQRTIRRLMASSFYPEFSSRDLGR